ncbi:MAG: hypothetical protein HC866_14990 [Leptolyngbyaceae cyanobacterium RU_5_1]|nr:hypothetical protein [Leptolyngbyaceae cyanobacterium RU_5_1]
MSQSPTLQAIIEFVEALSEDEQDVLFDLISKRRIAKRRQEIAQNAKATMQAVRNGTAQRGTAAELIFQKLEDEEEEAIVLVDIGTHDEVY